MSRDVVRDEIDKLRHKRGLRDGEENESPTDASRAYLDGYFEGRRRFAQKMARQGFRLKWARE